MRKTAALLMTAALGVGVLTGCASDRSSDRPDADGAGAAVVDPGRATERLAAQERERAARARERAADRAEARATAAEEAAREAEQEAEQALSDLESYRAPTVSAPPVDRPAPVADGGTIPDAALREYDDALPEYDYALPEYDYKLPEYDYALPEYDYELPEYDYALPEYDYAPADDRPGYVGGSTYPGAPGGLNEAGYPKNQYVGPYTRSDGTRVDGYWRNSPNDSFDTCAVIDC